MINVVMKAKKYLPMAMLVIVWAMGVAWHPHFLAAQQFSGFRGRVTDPSGAAIPGAQVKARQEATGTSRTMVTNSVGEYELQGLLPGTYTIEVSAKGFKNFVDSGEIVYPLQVRRVDVKLQVGEVSSTVTVTEHGSKIQTDTATISYTTPQKEIYALNTQSWLVYRIDLDPGAEARSQVHGGFANNTTTEQDGIPTNAYGSWRAPQETTQDIREISMNAPAEYKTSTTVVGVGKSGTNTFHGEVFVNYSNEALNALSPGQTSRPPGTPNTLWSFSAGGPVYIPKVYNGKNKTFFYFLYQPNSNYSSVFHNNFVVPTLKMRNGDLSEYANFRGIQIMNPYTGQPFTNNIIPKDMWSPVAANVLKLLPLPNHGPAGSLIDNYNWTDFSQINNRWYQFHIDQNISSKDTFSFVYYRFTNEEKDNLGGNPFPDNGFDEKDDTNSFSIQDSHTFTPRLLNEFEFAWNRQQSVWVPGPVLGKDYLTNLLGITDFGGFPIAAEPGAPRITVQTLGLQESELTGGYTPFPTELLATGAAPILGAADYTDAYVWHVKDNVAYVVGKHTFKTGLQVTRYKPYEFNAVTGDTFGGFDFTGAFTNYDFGDILLGLPYTTDIQSPRPKTYAREWEVGFYVQDDWKITPKLTFSPGIRFEHYGVPYEINGLIYNFDTANKTIVVPDQRAVQAVVPGYPIPVVTSAQAGYPSRLRNFKYMLADPRFGVAWRPFNKTVFRAAWGIYHVPYASINAGWATSNLFSPIDRSGLLAGLAVGPFQASANFGPNEIVNGTPLLTFAQPFLSSTTLGPQNVFSAPVDGRANSWPYDQQWNFTVERDLPWGFTGRASYVGSKGTDWPYVRNLNVPQASTIPFTPDRRPFGSTNLNNVYLFDLGGSSIYNGLELEVDRQYSKGLYFRGWFNWEKSLNDVLGGLFGSTTGNLTTDPYNRALDRGWQDGEVPFHTRWMASYELPFGHGERFLPDLPGVLNHIVGNWTIAPILATTSRQRYTPSFSGVDTANVGISGGRPNQVCDPNGFGSGPGIIWNAACFATPANGTYGNAMRGILMGPFLWDMDFSAFKTFYLLGGEKGPYFKVEMYSTNLFNHPTLSGPQSLNITSPNFGRFIHGGHRTIYFRLRIGI